jgi:hypothetical protein
MRKWFIALILMAVAFGLWQAYLPHATTSEPEFVEYSPEDVSSPDFTQIDSRRISSPRNVGDPEPSDSAPASDQQVEWPMSPENLEQRLISALLGLPGLENIVVESAECSPTECEVHVSASNADRNYYPVFSVVLKGLPAGLSVPLDVELAAPDSGEFDVLRMSIRELPPRDLTLFEFPAESLRHNVEALSEIYDFSVPRELLAFDSTEGVNVRVMVESICESDCSFGSKRIIYIDVPQGHICADLKGVEQSMLVGTQIGGLIERTFCVPNTLELE